MGRVKELRKNSQLQIRLTAAQKSAIHRLARRAGKTVSEWVLQRATAGGGDRFVALLLELNRAHLQQPVWAALHDLLESLSPSEFVQALPAPEVPLSPLSSNLVAAMVEYAAQRKGIEPPGWTATIQPLDRPWFASDLRSLHPYLMVHSPVAFRRRNLFVESSIGRRV